MIRMMLVVTGIASGFPAALQILLIIAATMENMYAKKQTSFRLVVRSKSLLNLHMVQLSEISRYWSYYLHVKMRL